MRSPIAALTLTLALLVGASPALADMPELQPYIGLTGGGTLRLNDWDLGTVEDDLEPGSALQFGLRLGFQLTSRFSLEAGAQYLPMSLDGDRSSGVLVYHGDLLFHLMKGNWSPFLVGGAGAYHVASGDLGDDLDYQVHLGLGLRGMVLDWLALRVEVRDVITDGLGAANTIAGNNLELTVGLDLFPVVAFTEKDRDGDLIPDLRDACPDVKGVASAQGCPDQDGDGVADAEDACPAEAGEAGLGGCPDRDGDGVADKDDACPDVAGLVALQGCPDQDGDGVTDAQDACPAEAGPEALKGCPDQDGDGIADKDDKCPEVAGVPALQGCPDQDGDGVTDAEDACPAEAGLPTLQGCPDQDGDGIADKDDKCPEVRGLPEFDGCLPKEAAKFTGSIKGINFALGKADLLPTSIPVLDQAVAVLEKFPSMRIRIEGHTDSTGDAAFNLKLSNDRAQTVMNYLVEKGIDPSRLQAEGFGLERPIADNTTADGRAQNRRVEFNLIAQ